MILSLKMFLRTFCKEKRGTLSFKRLMKDILSK